MDSSSTWLESIWPVLRETTKTRTVLTFITISLHLQALHRYKLPLLFDPYAFTQPPPIPDHRFELQSMLLPSAHVLRNTALSRVRHSRSTERPAVSSGPRTACWGRYGGPGAGTPDPYPYRGPEAPRSDTLSISSPRSHCTGAPRGQAREQLSF